MSYVRTTAAAWITHPGEILKKEFLEPMAISGYALAKAIGVTAQRVSDIVLEKSGISADMAIRLGKFFGTSAEFWMNLQTNYELGTASKKLKNKINKITPHAA
jgi:addiction module HigA family antidote